ncbi:MAG: hypothetical protein K0S33_3679 [Bacteroidetes bacterium]|jgi:hypothetical protein|nr:hypothetical protein [Bacteroidota bacterium]
MKKFSFFTIVIVMVLGGISVFSSSCNKPEPCKGIITVMDTTGTAVQAGVLVELRATVTTASGGTAQGDLKATGTTDGSGRVEFTLKLPAIMDIYAEKPNCTPVAPHYNTSGQYVAGSYCTGKAILKFEEGKTNEKIVYLKY